MPGKIEIIRANAPVCRAITKRLSITEDPCVYDFKYKGVRYRLTVPSHFIFDGASIPRLLWGALGLTPHGVMDGPGLPHDFCYHYQGDFPSGCYLIYDKYSCEWRQCNVPMAKGMSDRLLEALCVHFKACGKIKAALIWSGVAAFGFAAWHNDDDERKDLLLEHGTACQ